MAFHLYSRGRASGVYLQNAPIFPTNLIPDIREGFDAIWNVSIITTTTATFEYTIDGGTTFFPLGTANANVELIANIKADDNDSFNLRITDVAGGTVFRIIVSIAPEDIIRALMPAKVDICPILCDVPVINGSISPLKVNIENPVGTPIGGTLVSLTNTAITKDTDIFTAFTPTGTSVGDAVMFRIQWSAEDKGKLSYTLNNSDFVDLNDGTEIDKDSSHIFDVMIDDPDSFTLRFDKNTTIIFLRIVQLV